MKFERNIVEWIKLDDRINTLNKELKSLRENRNNYSNDIINHIVDNSMEKKVFQLTDNNTNIQYVKSNTYGSLTNRYLHNCFLQYFKEKNIENPEINADMLLDYIKVNRSITEKEYLKRN